MQIVIFAPNVLNIEYMTKKEILLIVLTALAAAIGAVIPLLSSCRSSTEFMRVTPADSLYYKSEREIYKTQVTNPQTYTYVSEEYAPCKPSSVYTR